MQSAAAQIIISIVPIVGIFMGAVVLFFYLLWRHREVKLQIKMGAYEPPKIDAGALSLFCGITLTLTGAAITIMFATLDRMSYSILGGLLPLATGISLLLFYKLNPNFHKKDGEK